MGQDPKIKQLVQQCQTQFGCPYYTYPEVMIWMEGYNKGIERVVPHVDNIVNAIGKIAN